MNLGLRDYLNVLSRNGHLREVDEPIDPRYVSALASSTTKAVWLQNLLGYEMSVASGMLTSRERLALAFDIDSNRLTEVLSKSLSNPLEPVYVDRPDAMQHEWCDCEVDLSSLPLPLESEEDGAPYLTSGVTITRDLSSGFNAGIYRLMLVDQHNFTINPDPGSDLHAILKAAANARHEVEVSVSVGLHPRDLLAAAFTAPPGTSELAIAGAFRGEPLELSAGRTVSVPFIANAEIVLEGKINPNFWNHDEGRFGEVDGLTGELHNSPILNISAVCHRAGAILHALHMPAENMWLMGPVHEMKAWSILTAAGIDVVNINVTQGGCCRWHIVVSIRKKPGDPMRAIHALLSFTNFKQIIVTSEEIDIFNPEEVEWAVATRAYFDGHLLMVPGNPSECSDSNSRSTGAVSARLGIDATVPDGSPPGRFRRIGPPFTGYTSLGQPMSRSPYSSSNHETWETAEQLSAAIAAFVSEHPAFYAQILAEFESAPYRLVVRAMGLLRSRDRLKRDETGRYIVGQHPSRSSID